MFFKEAAEIFRKENCFKIGKIIKPHANKGALNLELFVDLKKIKKESVFVETDNYLVPFFIDYEKSFFSKTNGRIKFLYIDTIEQAKNLSGKDIYMPKKKIEKIEEIITEKKYFILNFFIYNLKEEFIARIVDFLKDQKNFIYIIERSGKEFYLPYNFFANAKTDYKNKKIYIDIAQDLVNDLF